MLQSRSASETLETVRRIESFAATVIQSYWRRCDMKCARCYPHKGQASTHIHRINSSNITQVARHSAISGLHRGPRVDSFDVSRQAEHVDLEHAGGLSEVLGAKTVCPDVPILHQRHVQDLPEEYANKYDPTKLDTARAMCTTPDSVNQDAGPSNLCTTSAGEMAKAHRFLIGVKILASEALVAAVISSDNMADFHQQTGAHVEFCPPRCRFAHTGLRIGHVVASSQTAVRCGVRRVLLLLSALADSGSEGCVSPTGLGCIFHIVIPPSVAGLIIGIAGCKLRHLQDWSSATVKVSRSAHKTGRCAERLVKLEGNATAITYAVLHIFSQVLSQPAYHAWFESWFCMRPITEDMDVCICSHDGMKQFCTTISPLSYCHQAYQTLVQALLRAEPSLASQIIAVLPAGTVVWTTGITYRLQNGVVRALVVCCEARGWATIEANATCGPIVFKPCQTHGYNTNTPRVRNLRAARSTGESGWTKPVNHKVPVSKQDQGNSACVSRDLLSAEQQVPVNMSSSPQTETLADDLDFAFKGFAEIQYGHCAKSNLLVSVSRQVSGNIDTGTNIRHAIDGVACDLVDMENVKASSNDQSICPASAAFAANVAANTVTTECGLEMAGVPESVQLAFASAWGAVKQCPASSFGESRHM